MQTPVFLNLQVNLMKHKTINSKLLIRNYLHYLLSHLVDGFHFTYKNAVLQLSAQGEEVNGCDIKIKLIQPQPSILGKYFLFLDFLSQKFTSALNIIKNYISAGGKHSLRAQRNIQC